MKLERFIDLDGINDVSGLFFSTGSFGTIDHTAKYERFEENGKSVYKSINGDILLKAEFETFDNGLILRRDTLENVSKKALTITSLSSRFRVIDNDYEVYTQFSGWQHESCGGWQKLVTEISVASRGIRTCDGAAPMLALYNNRTGKSAVFHLFPNCQWRMTARKTPIYSKYEAVVVETGFEDKGLNFVVNAGEKIELPPVAFFVADNKTDLDAYKLHEVYNSLYPRKSMPVLYNSWLCDFGNIDAESTFKQIDTAAELGVEAFMIDAGWFGNGGGWWEQTGDWTENMTYGPKGRLKDISDRVHRRGMKFGLWFESERGGRESEAVKTHPEYYIKGRFFDFSIPAAREFMLGKVSAAIEKYSIDWLKFDFNDTISRDESGHAFYRYLSGQKEFIRALKEKYPDIYITNCASGGYRMELGQGIITDSFWLSDNQGTYDGIRIVKDTIKRLPPQLIERWTVHKYCDGFLLHGNPEKTGLMITTDNATWDRVRNLGDGFYLQFMTGGPIGFSCDIAAFPEKYKNLWKEHIAKFKEDRDFYLAASARILIDTEDVTAISYSDKNFDRIKIQVFCKDIHTAEVTVYPEADENAVYMAGDENVSGKELKTDGMVFNGLIGGDCKTIDVIKIK
ncbi:MAG: alpha-galactosidase [Clostridia bacterium]|nr:alpha-galactosidase [Clostridia bacterium]